jgi:hypothetical protein
MPTPWDTPPSADELIAAGWDTPPTAAEMAGGPPGMGDVRAAEAADAPASVVEGARNVPAAFLTNDPATDQRAAANLYEQGHQRALTTEDALRAGAIGGGALLAPVAGVPAAMLGGGLTSAGLSKSSEPGGIAIDAATGAVVSGAMAKALPPLLGWLGNKLRAAGINYGRKAITGVSSPLARRAPLADEVVEEAFRADAIRPGSNVGGVATRLQDAVDPVTEQYAEILKRLEAAGVTGPHAATLAAELAQEASTASANSIIGTRAKALQDASQTLVGATIPQHHGPPIVIPPKPTLPGGELGLMQSELMKRELQKAAASEFVKEGSTSLAGAARKELAGRFKDAIEQAVESQAPKAPAEVASFVPVKEQLHRLLSALGPAREAAARSTRRIPFGLHEAMGLASGVASGNPTAAVATPALMSALKERGASTLAWGANRAANALGAAAAGPVPGSVSEHVADPAEEAFIAWLRSKFGAPQVGLVPAAAEEPR